MMTPLELETEVLAVQESNIFNFSYIIQCPRSRASFKDVDNDALYTKVYANTKYNLKIAYYINNDIDPFVRSFYSA